MSDTIDVWARGQEVFTIPRERAITRNPLLEWGIFSSDDAKWNPGRMIVELPIDRELVTTWVRLVAALQHLLTHGYDEAKQQPFSEVSEAVIPFLPSSSMWAIVCFVDDQVVDRRRAYATIGRAVRESNTARFYPPYIAADLRDSEFSRLHSNFHLHFDPMNPTREWNASLSPTRQSALLDIQWVNILTGVLHSVWLTLLERYSYDAERELSWFLIPWRDLYDMNVLGRSWVLQQGPNESRRVTISDQLMTSGVIPDPLENALVQNAQLSRTDESLREGVSNGLIAIRYNQLHSRIVGVDIDSFNHLYGILLSHIHGNELLDAEEKVKMAGVVTLTTLRPTPLPVLSHRELIDPFVLLPLVTTQAVTGGVTNSIIPPAKIPAVIQRLSDTIGIDNLSLLTSILLQLVEEKKDTTALLFCEAAVTFLEGTDRDGSFIRLP